MVIMPSFFAACIADRSDGSVSCRHELLANDASEKLCQLTSDLHLLGSREYVYDTVYGIRGAAGVKGAEQKHTGLCSSDSR